jgi:hypothetical protein
MTSAHQHYAGAPISGGGFPSGLSRFPFRTAVWRAVERPFVPPRSGALPRLRDQSQPGLFPLILVGLKRLQTLQKPVGNSSQSLPRHPSNPSHQWQHKTTDQEDSVSKRTDESPEGVARQWLDRLEAQEARRFGVAKPIARARVAKRLGVAPGTLENVARGRLKGLTVRVFNRLQAAVIDALEADKQGLEHEIFLARQGGVDARARAVCAAEAALEEARKVLMSND